MDLRIIPPSLNRDEPRGHVGLSHYLDILG